ncbi:MAG: hypothetical protein J7K84_02730 [Deltaproteobacteria bacterium]|nr:hypothetical protein [Deltaproteobacteria bacterium]
MSTFKPVRFGKYLLYNKIATGGMPELYRAKITGVQGFEKLANFTGVDLRYIKNIQQARNLEKAKGLPLN